MVTMTRSNVLKLSCLNSLKPSPINFTAHSNAKMTVKSKLKKLNMELSKLEGLGYRSRARKKVFSIMIIIMPPLKYLWLKIFWQKIT